MFGIRVVCPGLVPESGRLLDKSSRQRSHLLPRLLMCKGVVRAAVLCNNYANQNMKKKEKKKTLNMDINQ